MKLMGRGGEKIKEELEYRMFRFYWWLMQRVAYTLVGRRETSRISRYAGVQGAQLTPPTDKLPPPGSLPSRD